MKTYKNVFERIVSPENLFLAWSIFRDGKQKKRDLRFFEWRLEENIFQLHRDLASGRYRHGPYSSFHIRDPKQRHIHKATVRDRILHHAVFLVLNPMFEETFIPTSFSCRIGKGNHRGVDVLERMLRGLSKNYTKPCFALKCDVRKFFDSVDHALLLQILGHRIKDEKVMGLLGEIIGSFSTTVVAQSERERERE